MLPSRALLSLLLVALSAVDASPLRCDTKLNTLSIAAKINSKGGANIVATNRARAQAMQQTGTMHKRDFTMNIQDTLLSYTASVGFGFPDPAFYPLTVDTASANMWIRSQYRSPTITDTGNSVSIYSTDGSVLGEEWTDLVWVGIGTGMLIGNQSFAIANSVSNFPSVVDGVMGIAPSQLSLGTVNNTNVVPNVVDSLFKFGFFDTIIVGIYFVPYSTTDSTGELCVGCTDTSKTTSPIEYYPITTKSPANGYWGIDMSIAYNNTVIMSTTSGIIDSVLTMTMIPSDSYQKYQQATGAIVDKDTGLLTITSEQYANLQTLVFNAGSTGAYPLTPNAQIWPRSLNNVLQHASSDKIYMIIGDIGHNAGTGINFMLGYTFLQRFYIVLDTTNQQIGLAPTEHTDDTTN